MKMSPVRYTDESKMRVDIRQLANQIFRELIDERSQEWKKEAEKQS